MELCARVAVLIDAENMTGDLADEVFSHALRHGSIIARRAFGDFSMGRGVGWIKAAAPHAIQAIQVPSPAKGKNASDMRMTIEAMELLNGGRADTFCLVSSDGDFTPLAIYLRGAGKRVVGIGGQRASATFRQSCDAFVVVGPKGKESSAAAPAAKPQATPKVSARKFQGLLPLMQAVVKMLGEETDNGWIHLARLGAALRVVEPDFAAKCQGLGTLKQILLREPALEVGRENGMFVRIRPGIAVLSA